MTTIQSPPTSNGRATERRRSQRGELERREEPRQPDEAPRATGGSTLGSGRRRVIYRPQGTTIPPRTTTPQATTTPPGATASPRRPSATRRPSPATPPSKPDGATPPSKPAGGRSGATGRARSVAASISGTRRSVTATAAAPATEVAPEPAQGPGEHLRLVERQPRTAQQRRRRRRFLIASLVSFTLAALFALVYLHVKLAQRQFELNRLQAEQARAQTMYQQRRLAVSQLSAPSRIISIAEARLGMVQPGSVTYLHAPAASTTSASSQSSATKPTGQASGGAADGGTDWAHMKPLLAGSP